jgi:hypothetical protein
MKCPKCGFEDNPQWRHSRFDFNADYIRFDEASADPFLLNICAKLKEKRNFEPFEFQGLVYYRRGTGGLWLYRCRKEDFKVPRERKKHERK